MDVLASICNLSPPSEHPHRLPRELVVYRDEGVVGREGAGGALAMNQQLHLLAINNVVLDLGEGVGWGVLGGGMGRWSPRLRYSNMFLNLGGRVGRLGGWVGHDTGMRGWCVGQRGARGALAVNQQLHLLGINSMVLNRQGCRAWAR